MNNLYETLSVNKNASADEIKRAYRKLASQHHPDKGGDVKKFQEIEEAYRTLSDPQKRQQYDNPSPFGQHGPQGFNHGGFDFQTIFDVFGARFNQPHPRTHRAQMTLWVTLQDVAQSGVKTISIGTPQGTQIVDIEIPAGVDDGDSVHYGGIGPGGIDIIITFRIHPNPKWQRQGPNLTVEYDVSVWDLILGSDLLIQDILGNQLSLNIPPRTQNKTTFRIRGRGLAQKAKPTGDLFIRVNAVIPAHIPESLIEAISQNRDL